MEGGHGHKHDRIHKGGEDVLQDDDQQVPVRHAGAAAGAGGEDAHDELGKDGGGQAADEAQHHTRMGEWRCDHMPT